ncbi:MAG TPA: exodeoxyribonuclease VII large subunit [Desulfosarcina sp.]|nr:exodeoxyribonuclease VII large subunit [Desulfosarcina sp.]
MLPGKISVISSPTGAAVRDFIHVAQRRFPNLPLEVVPVSVQGDRAPAEIIRAIRLLNEMASTDLIVLARGGGSIEDLSVFNDEQLVRTICDSQIPIVSAVGHETDFTLADFAADLRAPTPSAAAELCVPSKETLHNQLSQLNQKLHALTNFLLKTLKNRLASIEDRIVHPRRRIQDWHIRLDDYSQRLIRVAGDSLDRRRQSVAFYHSMLMQVSPARRLPAWRSAVDAWQRGLFGCARQTLIDRRNAVARHLAMLDALNPMAILQRGYSITRALPNRTIVHSARQVDIDQRLEVLLRQGRLTVTVNARDVESD